MDGLANKRVLVTGSTMGIGFGAVQALVRAGARVAVHGRSLQRAQEAVEQLGGGENLVAINGDVGELKDCRSMIGSAIDQLGGLDCLVNNAGIGELSYPEDVTDAHWEQICNVNLRSAFFLTQYALPELEKNKGSVIFTASAAGISAGPTDSFVYAVLKSGMISLGKSLAVELAPRGVRVNVLCPGYINTPLIAAENESTGGQVLEFINGCVPLARIGTIDECASSIAYLASDQAAYFTGSVIVNDGGCTAVRSWGGRN